VRVINLSLLFVFLSLLLCNAYADYSKDCVSLLNKKDVKGAYVYWETSSKLRDENQAKSDVRDLYLNAFLKESIKDVNIDVPKRCNEEGNFLEAANKASWSKLVAGSSSGVCLSALREACVGPQMAKIISDAIAARGKADDEQVADRSHIVATCPSESVTSGILKGAPVGADAVKDGHGEYPEITITIGGNDWLIRNPELVRRGRGEGIHEIELFELWHGTVFPKTTLTCHYSWGLMSRPFTDKGIGKEIDYETCSKMSTGKDTPPSAHFDGRILKNSHETKAVGFLVKVQIDRRKMNYVLGMTCKTK
jgi:hypothetical protein